MRRTGPTKISTLNLIREIDALSTKDKSAFWDRIAAELRKSRRNRREVNVDRINRVTKAGETIIVPGKVLGTGELNHKINVYALEYSGNAEEKINTNGKASLIRDLMKEGVKGKKVRIIG